MMRNFIGAITNKSIWTILLLIIAIWSAFAFYKAGFDKAEIEHERIILNQEMEIQELKDLITELAEAKEKMINEIMQKNQEIANDLAQLKVARAANK